MPMSRIRPSVAVATACAALLTAVGCASTVAGEPQSLMARYVERLHDNVELANSPEEKHEAFWTTVCDTEREIKADRPDHLADWERDLFAERYNEETRLYWMQLADPDNFGENGQFPLNRLVEDMANQMDNRESCDFRR